MWFNRLRTQLVSLRMWFPSLASLSGLKIQCFLKLRHELQMRLRFAIDVAVVVAAALLIRSLVWELPYAAGVALKRQKTNKQTKPRKWILWMHRKSTSVPIFTFL